MTGPIQFKEGRRIQFKLDLVKLKQHSIVKVGEWSPQSRLNITEPSLFFDTGSMNVTMVVITILVNLTVFMAYIFIDYTTGVLKSWPSTISENYANMYIQSNVNNYNVLNTFHMGHEIIHSFMFQWPSSVTSAKYLCYVE